MEFRTDRRLVSESFDETVIGGLSDSYEYLSNDESFSKCIMSPISQSQDVITSVELDVSPKENSSAILTSTPVKNVQKMSDQHWNNSSEINELIERFNKLALSNYEPVDSYKDESDYQELIQLVPRVYGKLKEDGHLEEWLQFMRMTDLNCFPSSNIAYLLYLDVVKWYSLGDSKLMRYSDEVKQFWRPLTGFIFLNLFGLLECLVMWLISMPVIKV